MEDLIFDQAFYSEYMDDLNYSQGFHVTPSKEGLVLVGGVRRVREYSDDRYRKADRAAKFAVEEHNNKAADEHEFLTFIKIVHLNVEPAAGAMYYITAAVADSAGEICHYQLKIWEKLNSGYNVEIFRPAPYCVKLSEKVAYRNSRVRIINLKPWMDENYLYYKCFLSATHEILGVEVIRGDADRNEANIWLRNSARIEKIVNKYGGRKMPHSDILYTFDL